MLSDILLGIGCLPGCQHWLAASADTGGRQCLPPRKARWPPIRPSHSTGRTQRPLGQQSQSGCGPSAGSSPAYPQRAEQQLAPANVINLSSGAERMRLSSTKRPRHPPGRQLQSGCGKLSSLLTARRVAACSCALNILHLDAWSDASVPYSTHGIGQAEGRTWLPPGQQSQSGCGPSAGSSPAYPQHAER